MMSDPSEGVETVPEVEEKKEAESRSEEELSEAKTDAKKARKSESAAAAARTAKIRQRNHQKVLEMEFIDNEYPKHSCTPVPRRYLKIDEYEPKADDTTATLEAEIDAKCVICDAGDAEGEESLMTCQGLMNGASRKTACRSKFHAKCMMNYNANGFLFQYSALPECQNKLLCPLHCCAACNVNHLKQSAYRGDLYECTSCLRSFHKDTCVPSGAKFIDVNVTWQEGEEAKEVSLPMIVCPSHAAAPKGGRHLKACHDCEDTEGLVECVTCVRSFHPECQEVQTINGQPIPPNRCEMCLFHDVIRFDVPVLVRWMNKQFYIGMTRDWPKYPKKQRNSATYYDTVGYVVVEWINEAKGKQAMFSIVAVSDIVELCVAYLPCASKSDFKFWRKTVRDHDTLDRIPPLCKEVNKPIQISFHVNKVLKRYVCPETGKCGCTGPNRCTTQECIYVADGCECPPECSKGQVCHNRDVSDRKVNQKIEQRMAGRKGFGVFATATIKKGEFIAEYAGEIINRQEKERRQRMVAVSRDFEANHYMMDTKDGMTVDAARAGNISRYINHSCSPNAGSFFTRVFVRIEEDTSLYDHRVYVKAIRDIEPEEEVTFDYGMNEKTGTRSPTCKCGAPNCTGRLSMKVLDGDDEDVEEEQVEEEEEEEEEEKKAVKKPRNGKRKANSKVGCSPPPKRNAVGVTNERPVLDAVENLPTFAEETTSDNRRKSSRSSLRSRC